jgi:nitroreductase
VLVPSHKREDLGQAFVQALQMRDIQAGPAQLQAAYEKAFRAPCLMLGVLDTAPVQAEIETSERLISLGCAVQNMLLMAQTLGLGSGITSGKAMNAPSLRSLFQLTEHEQGVCFLNFGTVSTTKPARSRPVVEEFVSSL